MELGCGRYENLCVGFLGGLRCALLVKGRMELCFMNLFFGNICIVLDFDFL